MAERVFRPGMWVGALVMLGACSCASRGNDQTYSGGSGTSASSTGGGSGSTSTGGTGPYSPGPSDVGSASSSSGSAGTSGGTTQVGQLTTGTWDDNVNFDFYASYLATRQVEGVPSIPRQDRVVVRVHDALGIPLAGATVSLRNASGETFHTITGGEGTAIILPTHDGITSAASATVRASLGSAVAEAPLPAAGDLVLALEGTPSSAVGGLDAVLLLDATGSMGDEAAYLLQEFDAITSAISADFPGVTQRWGLVHYRDTGDAYVVHHADFTSDLAAFRGALGAVHAEGGGDYEEAVEEGLHSMVDLSWRDGAVARVVFHVADAPHHADRTARLLAPLRSARELGVHIYPVASSGTDARFEHTFRTFAQVTGGRYLFLTDDSGIGGEHAEPTLPCYRVTTLQRAMLRMIRIELTGAYSDADPADVIRVGGDPHDGRCTLQDGTQVRVF